MDVATLATARTRAADYLDHARNADGSWGYLQGQAGAAEPTLLAVAAGRPAPLDWLATADLGYAVLLLPAALAGVASAEELIAASLERILAWQGVIIERAPGSPVVDDFTIPGWSWVVGASAWVEPTAYAVISLHRAGEGAHERALAGQALLRNRQCADGGWNYGNTAVLGSELEHEIAPTCWAAMALPSGPEVDRALPLAAGARSLQSTLTLALGTLVHVAHGADFGDLPELLLRRQRPDGSFAGRADWTALALSALRAAEEGSHAFVLRR